MSTHCSFGSFLLVVASSALGVACSDDEAKTGEVMVVVTSDMAVPTDFDSLGWSVTLSGETTPFASGSLELESSEDLPATLSVASGPKTTEPVTIRIEGRRRSDGDRLLVANEARLEVPTDRVARLSMPLSWLCSDANLSEACPEGRTCRAGACVDAAVVASSLPNYETPATEPCLDVSSCLADYHLELLPTRNRETGACMIRGSTALGEDAHINVALVVDNERVGNYGFCGPLNECYILLPRSNTPEGWQVVATGETPEIRLPDSVCDHVERSIAGIAFLRPTPECPIGRAEQTLCAPPPDTCLPAEICPASWPGVWQGFACSGAASTWDEDPNHEHLIGCWTPPAKAGEPSVPANGRLCCTTGEAPSADPLLIDDMSGGPQVKITPPEGQIASWWYSSLGDGAGSLEPAPPPALFTYRTFDPPVTPDDGPEIKAAACLRSSGFLGYVALQGFDFTQEAATYGAKAMDLSEYSGISFWGWAHEPFPDAPLSIQVHFPNVDTHYDDKDASCWTPDDASARCDDFQADISLTSKWQKYVVRFDELHQSRDEWSPPQVRFDSFDRRVYSTAFIVPGGRPDIMSQPFDFCVAHIRFTR